MLEKFSYLEFSLAILSFVGLKMLLHEIEIPEWASFSLLGIVVSLRMNKLKRERNSIN
jgi:predicted tellurium resistance membrane protein TerC